MINQVALCTISLVLLSKLINTAEYAFLACDDAIKGFDGYVCVDKADSQFYYNQTADSQKFLLKSTKDNKYVFLERRAVDMANNQTIHSAYERLQNNKFFANMRAYKDDGEYFRVIYDRVDTITLKEAIDTRKYFKVNRHIIFFFNQLIDIVHMLKMSGFSLVNLNYDTILVTKENQPFISDFHSMIGYGKKILPHSNLLFADSCQLRKWDVQKGPIDEKSSVWSLGVILYYMEERRLPFTGQTSTELQDNLKNGVIIRKGVSLELARIIDACLKYYRLPRATLNYLKTIVTETLLQANFTYLERDLAIDLRRFLPTQKISLVEHFYELFVVLVLVFFVIPSAVYLISKRMKHEAEVDHQRQLQSEIPEEQA